MGKKIQCIGRYVMDCQTLGKGNFARVELATHSVTGCKVAIKIIDTRKIKEDYVRQNLHREARILGQLRHPNIIRLYETLKATTLYCLVLECAAGGDLQTYIKQMEKKYLSEDMSRSYLRQLVSAVHYLHERGVAHRDLKMENIMLDEKKRNVKIVDFGLSNTFSSDELMKTHCGSLDYAAPELFTNEKYGPEVDIWSLGVITYAMVVGKLPFTTPYTDQYRRTKLKQQIEKGLSTSHEKEMIHLSEDCKQLLKKLLEPVSSLRLPLMDVEIHPWITCDAKMPFYPFHAFPRDKSLKSQVIYELADMLSINKEQIEKTVHENKCDDFSAMFNMMMDTKRLEKGIFEIDFTLYQERKREAREKQRKKDGPSKSEKDTGNKATSTATTSNMTPPHKHGNDTDSPHKTEAERLQAEHDHKVSTNFDFMALCSAPNWLGPERRRSRRRRNAAIPPISPFPQNVDSAQISTETLAVSQGTPDNPNLLSPNQTALPVPFNRRSRRRRSSKMKQRSSSYGPTNRKSMLQQEHLGTGSNSQPNSPTAIINPSITIDPPKTSPISRPDKLGIQGCYEEAALTLHVPDLQTRNQNSESLCLDELPNYSDVSNPNSASDVHSSVDGSADNISGSMKATPKCDWVDSKPLLPTADITMYIEDFNTQGKKSKPGLKETQHDSVEARIASTDIKNIVKPKQRMARKKDIRCNLLTTNLDHSISDEAENGMSSSQVEIFPEASMQKGDYPMAMDYDCQACGSDSDFMYVDESVDEMNLGLSEIHLTDLDCSRKQGVNERPTELMATGPLLPAMEIIQPVEVVRTRCGNPLTISGRSPQKQAIVASDSDSNPKEVSLKQKHKEDSLKDDSSYAQKNEILCLPVKHTSEETSHSMKNGRLSNGKHLKMENSVSQKLDLNLPIQKNSIQEINDSKESNGKYFISVPNSEGKDNDQGEDKLSPLTPVDSYSKHLYKFSMPSTPTRNMFKTPLARIESFHSDDFDALMSSSNLDTALQSNATTPSSCSHTPTLPCFAYKLNLNKKKNAKLKSHKSAKSDISCGKNSTKYAIEGNSISELENIKRNEPTCTDSLLMSSGSVVGIDRQEEGTEKSTTVSKAKVHPMDKDEQDTEMLILGSKISTIQKNKCNADSTGNDIKAKKTQNSVERPSKHNSSDNKKTTLKCSPWKHGFVQFLKKRRQSPSHRSRNNNDSIRSNQYSSATRNGHTRTSYSKALMRSSQDESSGEMETHFNATTHPNYSDALEVCSSPVPGHSPSPGTTKMFDFTVITNDSPPSKSCLLSWKRCGDCTFSDDQNSDEGETECTYRFEQSVDVAIKTSMAIKSVQDAKTYSTYKYAHT